MSSLAKLHLQSNTKINFNGGNLSSDAEDKYSYVATVEEIKK